MLCSISRACTLALRSAPKAAAEEAELLPPIAYIDEGASLVAPSSSASQTTTEGPHSRGRLGRCERRPDAAAAAAAAVALLLFAAFSARCCCCCLGAAPADPSEEASSPPPEEEEVLCVAIVAAAVTAVAVAAVETTSCAGRCLPWFL